MAPKSKDLFSSENTHLLVENDVNNNNDDESLIISSNNNSNSNNNWSRNVQNEVSKQLETALPTLQGFVLTKIPWMLSLRFVGEIGAEELAAAALATTLCNVTGLSLSVGLSSALTTLSGQAKGEIMSRRHRRRSTNDNEEGKEHEENYESIEKDISSDNENDKQQQSQQHSPLMTLVFLYRGLIIQLMLVLPVGIWWLMGIEDFLIGLGQTESLSRMTSLYLKVLSPGLFIYSVNWTLTSWLQSIGMADIPAKAAIYGLVCHIPFNLVLIKYYGYYGVGMATVCFQLVQLTYNCSNLYFRSHTRLLHATGGTHMGRTSIYSWHDVQPAITSLRGYVQYLYLAIPGIISISEWWASEVVIFLSGRLIPSPEAAVGGITIYQSLNSFCFMFPVAFSVAASTRISNLLGGGDHKSAAFAAVISLCSAGCISMLLGFTLYSIPHTFLPSLFAPDEVEVVREASKTIPLLSLYVFADGLQCTFNGIIKGCGRQCITIPIVVFAYWMIGVPLAYHLAFVRNDRQMYCENNNSSATGEENFCGIVGLVAGMTVGTWIHLLLMAISVLAFTNWKKEAKKAKERVVSKL